MGLIDDANNILVLIDRILAPYSFSSHGREPLERRLPSRESIVVDFIGRNKERNELWSWFKDPVSRRWALAGEGGKGKSAIAFHFALEVIQEAPQPYQFVFWMTAKRKRFLEGKVIITEPDFFDLDSAVSCILSYYGWIDEISLPINSKTAKALELFNEFPALIVVDDVDSLESENENVIEFFSFQVPKTNSKVLFTSRRTIFGMGSTTTHVAGFSEQDAEKFIFSRCQLMSMDPSGFSDKIIKNIIEATDGSPLYIEDLMRFSSAVKSIDEAISIWEVRKGNEARRYALKRECDLLTSNARKVLITACICPDAASFAEIESISAMPTENITASLQELQDLFLVPKPKLIEGEQRFDINFNTRALVRETYCGDDIFRRLDDACKAICQGVPPIGRGAVGAIIRQALFLERSTKLNDAEKLLLNALEKYHTNADLYGVLAKIYKNWRPPRINDAREKFYRAWQLRCSKQEMYEHWCQLEIREKEWTKAAVAAEKGLKWIPENKKLLYLAGSSRSKLAKDLISGLHHSKAEKELKEAKRLLEKAIYASSQSDLSDSNLNSDIYRSLVLTCELLEDKKALKYYFKIWLSEHPDNRDAISEWNRISLKFKISIE